MVDIGAEIIVPCRCGLRSVVVLNGIVAADTRVARQRVVARAGHAAAAGINDGIVLRRDADGIAGKVVVLDTDLHCAIACICNNACGRAMYFVAVDIYSQRVDDIASNHYAVGSRAGGDLVAGNTDILTLDVDAGQRHVGDDVVCNVKECGVPPDVHTFCAAAQYVASDSQVIGGGSAIIAAGNGRACESGNRHVAADFSAGYAGDVDGSCVRGDGGARSESVTCNGDVN